MISISFLRLVNNLFRRNFYKKISLEHSYNILTPQFCVFVMYRFNKKWPKVTNFLTK